jgi:hypothetical protein
MNDGEEASGSLPRPSGKSSMDLDLDDSPKIARIRVMSPSNDTLRENDTSKDEMAIVKSKGKKS